MLVVFLTATAICAIVAIAALVRSEITTEQDLVTGAHAKDWLHSTYEQFTRGAWIFGALYVLTWLLA